MNSLLKPPFVQFDCTYKGSRSNNAGRIRQTILP